MKRHIWRRRLLRVVAFFRKQPLDHELDLELASHLQMAEDDMVSQGVERTEARRMARLQLGGLGAVREHHRDSRGLPFLDVLGQDLRHAVRTLKRDRGFTIVAVLVLALGLGATATVFSVVDAVLLQPLPFASPERLAWISNAPAEAGESLSGVSSDARIFESWRQRNRSFEAMAAYFAFFNYDGSELLLGDKAMRVSSVSVTWNFLDVLGVPLRAGRSFKEEEGRQRLPVVILGYDLWRQKFQSDPTVVGQAITLDNGPVTVVGVLPQSFDFASVFAPGSHVDLLTPMNLEVMGEWGNTLAVVGRMRPEVSIEQARIELAAMTAQLKIDRPGVGVGHTSDVMSLSAFTHRSSRQGLLLLLGCVGAVLAIASANIAGLQLARAAKRRQEFAVRAALGAGRFRLVRQLVTEGLVLASISAILGTGLAYAAISLFTRLPHTTLPLLQRVRLDGVTLGCMALATMVVGIVCGLTPMFQTSLVGLRDSLRDSTARGASDGSWQKRVRSGLVIAETALACMLLIAATLLMRSFSQILDVDLGFQPQHALTLSVEPDVSLETKEAQLAYFDRLRRGLEAMPEVQAVGLTDALPLDRHRSWGVAAKGHNYPNGQRPAAFVSRASPGLFEALGIDLMQGRLFSPAEAQQGPPVVVINERMAQQFWPGLDPLGQIAEVGLDDATVIGIVSDVHHLGPEVPTGLDAYLPIGFDSGPNTFDLVIRTELPPETTVASIIAVLKNIDPTLPVDGLRPLAWFLDRATFSRRFVISLLGGFAAFALLLACLGIYGVIAYTTGRRSREIGLRMALGATASDILRRVLGETLTLASFGVITGVVGGILLGQGMRSLLFGISPNDPLTFAIMLAAMSVVTLAAGFIPAMRAARIEPSSTLRSS